MYVVNSLHPKWTLAKSVYKSEHNNFPRDTVWIGHMYSNVIASSLQKVQHIQIQILDEMNY